MRYLVVVPAYNEARHITEVVRGLSGGGADFIIIDDGSEDSTPEILEGLGVKFLRQPHMGKGAALKAGFRYAAEKGYDWVITMDGDGQHDLREIPIFLAAIASGSTDMVIGSRMSDTSRMPLARLLTNRFMSRLISAMSGLRIPDTQCGFRAIRRSVLDGINLETSHYDTESELLMKAGRSGFRISSIPISTIYNGQKSSINKVTDTARFIRLIFRILKSG